ncbi:MAG: hypothetical protein VCA55_10805 [Verrucomicrobiales bacterium]
MLTANGREKEKSGYFPTKTETLLLSGDLLGTAGYPRSRAPFGSESGGPDLSTTGIWKYDDPDENFFEKHDKFFNPIDSALGFFSPRESINIESDNSFDTNFSLDPGLPFTRQFNPDLAHLKAGPLYFDLLSVSAKALYSDYQSEHSPLSHDDGWLSILELSGRAYARLTDDLYFSLSATLYYLPGDGKWGVDLGAASQSFARFNWNRKIDNWDIHIYDEFKVLHRANDMLDPLEIDEIQTAGRYRLGRSDNARANGYFDDAGLVYSNVIAAQGTRPVGQQWRFWTKLDHTDFWHTTKFANHHVRDRGKLLLAHEGTNIAFSPYLSYNLTTRDRFDSLLHQAWLGTTGRFTENIRVNTRLGHHWNSGASKSGTNDTILYEGGVIHEINSSTRQSLYAGLVYDDDVYGDDGLYKYTRYTLNHTITPRIAARLFIGAQNRHDDEDLTRWNTGLHLSANITDYMNIRLLARYENTKHSSIPVSDRWIYRAGMHYRIMSRLHLELNYQYEDFHRSDGGFHEHFFYAALTRTF